MDGRNEWGDCQIGVRRRRMVQIVRHDSLLRSWVSSQGWLKAVWLHCVLCIPQEEAGVTPWNLYVFLHDRRCHAAWTKFVLCGPCLWGSRNYYNAMTLWNRVKGMATAPLQRMVDGTGSHCIKIEETPTHSPPTPLSIGEPGNLLKTV